VIAIMVAMMVIAAAGGLALNRTAHAAAGELSGGITVQIIEARPEVRAEQARQAVKLLEDVSGISEVELVSQAEVDALVEPWLGAGGDEAGMVPIPALIDARMSGTITPKRLASLQRKLRKVAPAARVDAQSNWLKPVFGAIDSLQWLAVALIGLLGVATVFAVLLAARTALGANRSTIEIVHLLGGTDAQIARIFQRSTAMGAAGGGIAGFAAAITVIFLIGRRFAGLGAGMISGGTLGWTDWALLALIPIAGVILATLTARWTVMLALRRML
jgi:cell division transport system permease protein